MISGMSRPLRIASITVAVILFLVISGLLTRFLSVENAEREDDLALLRSEVAGSVAGTVAKLSGCAQSPSCVAKVELDTTNPRILHKGSVKIIELNSNTAYSLTGSTGETRLAWTVIGKLPVVQCVLVKRSGNFLTGISVHLRSLSTPIVGDAGCSPHEKNEEEEIE
jgi:hypothetical protein